MLLPRKSSIANSLGDDRLLTSSWQQGRCGTLDVHGRGTERRFPSVGAALSADLKATSEFLEAHQTICTANIFVRAIITTVITQEQQGAKASCHACISPELRKLKMILEKAKCDKRQTLI